MGILGKLLLVLFSAIILIGSAPVASAQDAEEQTLFQESFAGCVPEEVPEEERSLLDTAGRILAMPGCSGAAALLDPAGAARSAGNNIGDLSGFWDSAVGEFTQSVIEGNTEVMQTAMTFWMDYSSAGFGGASVESNMVGVQKIVYYLAVAMLVASFIVGGFKIAASRRVGLQDGIEESAGVLGRWLLFSLAMPAIVPGALIASDVLADDIMTRFGGSADELVEIAALDEGLGGPIVLLLLALISIAGGVMQLIALVIRVLVAPIMAGLLPLFAAASFTETGKSGLQTMVNFLIAAIIFKPVSALLYCVVLWTASAQNSTDSDLITTFVQVTMMAAAGFVAPALVFKIVPMAAAAGGGNAAGMMAAGAGALGAVSGVVGGAAGGVGRALSGAGGAAGAAGRSGAAGASAQSTMPAATGSGPGGGSSGGSRSGASTPKGASGSRFNRQTQTSRPAGAGGVARRYAGSAARATGGVASGAAAVSRGISSGTHGVRQASYGAQQLLSESIGTEGYAGQIRR